MGYFKKIALRIYYYVCFLQIIYTSSALHVMVTDEKVQAPSEIQPHPRNDGLATGLYGSIEY